MTREHKYRAWDEAIKEMFCSDKEEAGYFFEFKDGILKGFAIRDPRPSRDPMEPPEPYCDEYPVEEFTGKLDSKRQEICEGDNVQIKSDDYDYDYVSTVRWDETIACLILDYPPGRAFDFASIGWVMDIVEKENGTVEVIGNIHSPAEGEQL